MLYSEWCNLQCEELEQMLMERGFVPEAAAEVTEAFSIRMDIANVYNDEGDPVYVEDVLITNMLDQYDLATILRQSDVSEWAVLAMVIKAGLIDQEDYT